MIGDQSVGDSIETSSGTNDNLSEGVIPSEFLISNSKIFLFKIQYNLGTILMSMINMSLVSLMTQNCTVMVEEIGNGIK